MNRIRAFGVLVALLLAPAHARATLIIGYGGTAPAATSLAASATTDNSGKWIGASWHMNAGQDFDFTSATAFDVTNLGFAPFNGSPLVFVAAIYSDQGGHPGSLLTTLIVTPASGRFTTGTLEFAASTPLVLQGGVSYWLLMNGTHPTFDWFGPGTSPAPTGPYATYAGVQAGSGGFGSNPVPGNSLGNVAPFEVYGTLVGAAPVGVPEPASLLLAGLAIGGTSLASRLRRKPD